MGHSQIKILASIGVMFLFAFSCSNGNSLTGNSTEDKKEAKKSKPDDNSSNFGNTSATENNGTQPQVITGAYLSCVQDAGVDTRSGESAFGCGMYSTQTEQKYDLTGKTLQLSTTDLSGQVTSSRTVQAAPTSQYQQYLYTTTNIATLKIHGRLLGSAGEQQFDGFVTPIIVKTIDDGYRLKQSSINNNITRTPAEIGAWCSLVTQIPDNPMDMQLGVVKGTACGSFYLSKHGWGSIYGVSIPAYVSGVGSIIDIFTGKPAGTTMDGVCSRADIPNPNRDNSMRRCLQ